MYNRYIRNDRGIYTRITEDDGPPSETTGPESDAPPRNPSPQTSGAPSGTAGPQSEIAGPESGGPPHESPPQSHGPPRNPPPQTSGPSRRPHAPPSGPPNPDPLSGFLRQFVDFSALERLDAGDLLLLGLLFLLYREGADEETVLALGLLLIL